MKKIIVLNHKSTLEESKAKIYPVEINKFIRNDQNVIICPSSLYIPYFKGKYNFKLGSQTISYENNTGSLTGNILKSAGVKYSIIDNQDTIEINKSISECLNNNISPIVIIGETFYENELGKTMDIITKTIKQSFKSIEMGQDIIICYRPNWSYKAKQIPSIKHIEEVIELVKNIIKKSYGFSIKVIYGGNINKENIKELDKILNLDGYLLDEISADVKSIKEIFNIME